jgi:hypothetical protein
MPILSNRAQVAIAQEANAGTPETLVAGDVVLHTDIPEWEPEVQVTPRNALSASLSPRGSVMGTQAAKIRFKQFLQGTSVAPVQDTTMPPFRTPFLGCGAKDTVSGAPTAEQTSFKPLTSLVVDETAAVRMTVAIFQDGKRYQIHGAVGNCVLTCTNGQPVLAEYEFTGVYAAPTDVALLVPSYPTIVEPPFLSAAISVLGYASSRITSFTLDFGNEIVMVPNPNDAVGFAFAQIVNRNPTGTLDPEDVLAGTKNYFTEWILGTTGSITTGVFPSNGTNYNQLQITIPKAAYVKVGHADREGMANSPIEFECRANTDAGDDEWEVVHT